MFDYRFLKTNRRTVCRLRSRRGITAAELIVSAVLLMTVMSFVTTICLRINLVWKDINHHRVAVCELSNQLEELTLLSPPEAQAAIESLQPSAICARSLRKPELAGKLIEDEFGSRIVLQIDWDRRNPGKPVELVGWIASGASQ